MTKKLALAYHNLSVMLDTGMPILRSLETLVSSLDGKFQDTLFPYQLVKTTGLHEFHMQITKQNIAPFSSMIFRGQQFRPAKLIPPSLGFKHCHHTGARNGISIRIFGTVFIIVITDKVIAVHLPVNRKDTQRQNKTNA